MLIVINIHFIKVSALYAVLLNAIIAQDILEDLMEIVVFQGDYNACLNKMHISLLNLLEKIIQIHFQDIRRFAFHFLFHFLDFGVSVYICIHLYIINYAKKMLKVLMMDIFQFMKVLIFYA